MIGVTEHDGRQVRHVALEFARLLVERLDVHSAIVGQQRHDGPLVDDAEHGEFEVAHGPKILANSAGSLAAYKDLYREALDGGLQSGLAYEAATRYDCPEGNDRIATFR